MSASGKMAMIAAMSYMMQSDCFSTDRPARRTDPLDGIDIEKEYHLILQKKSGLSARLRSMVMYRYERNMKGGN